MKTLNIIERRAINTLSSNLQDRLNEPLVLVNKTQEDPETLSSLCELIFTTKKSLVWVRSNGSISSVSGTRLLLVGGRRPKGNPPLSCFTQNI